MDTAKNIGMIARTTTTIPTTSFVQTFKYDSLDRLTEAKEKSGSTTNWQQTFGYDRFGNRSSFSQTVNGNSLTLNSINNPTIDPANNRFTIGQGYEFDYNGNLIHDAEGRNFTFDGNDKQVEVRDPSNNVVGTYKYDASGARVKKITNTETTVFVYDAAGALAAEYSTQIETQHPQTSYLTADHLGSPRVITDEHGQVTARRDFMPFGEEIGAGVGARTSTLKYQVTGTDNVRKRYTGYEKDAETGLDFAEARMYENRHGRFTAVDPLMASADPINPQTFNRYSYTGNNPVNETDPSGLDYYQDANGNVKWYDNDPGKGWSNLTEKYGYVRTVGPEFSRAGAEVGSIVQYHANHTITVIKNPTDQQVAQATAAEVQVTCDLVTESTSVEISSSVTSRQVDPLPDCVPDYICTGLRNISPVDDPEAADDNLQIVLAGCGFFFEPCDIIDGGISAARGDWIGAALTAPSVIPILGIGTDVTKISRKVSKIENAAEAVNDGRRLRNAHLANKVHPRSGVPFDADGFPNFSGQLFPSGVNDVIIKPTGRNASDFAAANKAAGYNGTPKGYTWHHHQDTGRMQLLLRKAHEMTGHTGGVHLW